MNNVQHAPHKEVFAILHETRGPVSNVKSGTRTTGPGRRSWQMAEGIAPSTSRLKDDGMMLMRGEFGPDDGKSGPATPPYHPPQLAGARR